MFHAIKFSRRLHVATEPVRRAHSRESVREVLAVSPQLIASTEQLLGEARSRPVRSRAERELRDAMIASAAAFHDAARKFVAADAGRGRYRPSVYTEASTSLQGAITLL